jgi:hypothetical protein
VQFKATAKNSNSNNNSGNKYYNFTTTTAATTFQATTLSRAKVAIKIHSQNFVEKCSFIFKHQSQQQ